MTPKPNGDDGDTLQQANFLNCVEMKQKIKEIVISNGITDSISEVIIKDAGLRGEGFNSLTKYVTVNFENLEKKPLDLFVKVQTGNPSHTQVLNEMKAFEKEARFLNEYVKEAEEMCKQKGQTDLIDFYPKCYYADENMVVLENLVVGKGYKLIDKQERQNLECAKFAIKTLAKHHAISHAMINENGGTEKFFKKFVNFDHEAYESPHMIGMMEGGLNDCIKSNVNILETHQVPGAQLASEKLRSFIGKPFSNAVMTFKRDSLLVLGHGDYWNNNMLFLFDKISNKIVHHVAVDFQIVRYNSPGIDLGYYFFTSVQPQVRQAYLKELLTLYMDTLNKVTDDLGYPMNLSFDEIFTDFRKKMVWGYWWGLMMTVGPGMGLYKDVDMSKIAMNDWADLSKRLIKKWMEDNPEKAKETAMELVGLVREYEELVISS